MNPITKLLENFENDLKDIQQKTYGFKRSIENWSEVTVADSPVDIVYTEDKMHLLHYRRPKKAKEPHNPPLLITYALINRYIMLDLEPERSFIKNLLTQGIDIYLIDWGYPSAVDRYLDLDDYINHYMDTAVNWIRAHHQTENINLMGICMGGTLSLIYAALYPDKIKNLIGMATPLDCDIDDGVLFIWAKLIDVDKAVDVLGNMPGDLMNMLYLLAVPVATVDKYIRFLQKSDNPKFVNTFLRMEKWIYDSPDIAGEAFRQYLKDIFQKNLLIKNQLIIGSHTIDLKRIKCPVLNVCGKADYLVPPSSARPISNAVGSKDVVTLEFDTGHIGMFVGSTSQKRIGPKVAEWIKEH